MTSEWTSDAAALDAAAAERETSISELQAMLASMGQPAPPPPPAVDPPASVAARRRRAAVPAATLDIMPPPSPAKKAPAPAPTAAPALASAAAAPAAPASAEDFRRENGAEVAAMLAAEAPATTPQQCTAEVGGLLSRLQAADIPASRGRFKLKVMKPDEAMGGKKQRPAGGPPLGTSAALPESPESVDAPEARGGARRLARSADDALGGGPGRGRRRRRSRRRSRARQSLVSPEPSLLSQEEDMLFAEAVLAEAARLARRRRRRRRRGEEDAEADAIVADAVAAEALFDDYARRSPRTTSY